MNDEGVSRLGSFNEERAGLRIASRRSVDPGGVNASRVDRVSNHVVAGLDSQHRLMTRGEGVVELLGLKPMCFSEAWRGQDQNKEQLHFSDFTPSSPH
jgi:hypothetical protein